MDTEELEAVNPLRYSPFDVDGGVLGPPFPVVHDQLLCLADVEGEVVVLAPHRQVSALLPIGCLIVIASSANLMMVLESCATTMEERGPDWRECFSPAGQERHLHVRHRHYSCASCLAPLAYNWALHRTDWLRAFAQVGTEGEIRRGKYVAVSHSLGARD